MLKLFDQIIREAPAFEQNDLVGFPINAILDWWVQFTISTMPFV